MVGFFPTNCLSESNVFFVEDDIYFDRILKPIRILF